MEIIKRKQENENNKKLKNINTNSSTTKFISFNNKNKQTKTKEQTEKDNIYDKQYERNYYYYDEGFDEIKEMNINYDSLIKRNEEKRKKLLNIKQKNKNEENERWINRQMKAAGIKVKNEEIIEEIEDIPIFIKNTIPKFLEGKELKDNNENEIILPIKDSTSDISQLSRRISQTMINFKEKKEREKYIKRNLTETNSILNSIDKNKSYNNNINNKTIKNNNNNNNNINVNKELTIQEKIDRKKKIDNIRKSLPIYESRNEILNVIKENQAVVIVGETGSGKTTQLCQYLYESGYYKKGKIGCTQPRRVLWRI